ncbi:MAG: hypothetical protein E3J90_02725 [Promethearchaeota archaeon]|nr:MAG: hypothetical protein E3J90_02725 [Candidatus Lokiarchaeota archaeon]
MNEIVNIVSNIIDFLNDDVFNLYRIYESYVRDLIISKKVNISAIIDNETEEEISNTIFQIISATNSAFVTIGVSKNKIMSNQNLFQNAFLSQRNIFTNYLSFLQLGLKDYINKHLFVIIIEYIIDAEDKILENLDLFDLLPRDFLSNLRILRKKYVISEESKKRFKIFCNEIESYFNPSNLTFNKIDFEIQGPKEDLSEDIILKRLQDARVDNLEVLQHPTNREREEGSASQIESQSLLSNFLDFPTVSHSILEKIRVDVKQLINFVNSSPEFLDLENLFYSINIIKMLGLRNQLEPGYIKNIMSNYINGGVFSTGRYHIPNPMSVFYGLSILHELNLLNGEIIDLLNIEMFLENELNNFVPENIILHFFTILCFKMLEKTGGIITDKKYLLEPLAKVDVFNLEGFKPASDIFYFLGLISLLDKNVSFNNFREPYLSALKNKISANGSLNENITETARGLLSLQLLGLQDKELNIISGFLNFLNQNVNMFKDESNFAEFDWKNDKIAFKIELRMLFWVLLAFSQYF